ncbi:DUF6688 family protein [Bacillus sp. 03113]|uniref:DUF6688 domain-containing protein n=1 Tax=Bacillus sp. 03113 TaxID=2578211 RepID=UPI002852F2FB|nr:DUF6688 family protein [Bacillus sp. 03113]
MKPYRWFFLFELFTLDNKPENRINDYYRLVEKVMGRSLNSHFLLGGFNFEIKR